MFIKNRLDEGRISECIVVVVVDVDQEAVGGGPGRDVL